MDVIENPAGIRQYYAKKSDGVEKSHNNTGIQKIGTDGGAGRGDILYSLHCDNNNKEVPREISEGVLIALKKKHFSVPLKF